MAKQTKKTALARDPKPRAAAPASQKSAAPLPQKSAALPPPASTPATSKSAATGPSRWTRTGPGQYKDQYGNVLKGQPKAPTKDMSKGKAPASTAPQGPAAPTPESVTQEGFMGAGQAYQDMLQKFQGEQYQPNFEQEMQRARHFEQEMERARQNVMGQFDRRNAQAFAQQRQDFETSMANRGIAPGGEQYNRELKALTDRQDMARQEAMGAAEQAAYGVQQQQFGQAGDLAMRPYEQWGVLQQPYMAGIGAQYGRQDLLAQQQFAAQEAEKERRNRLQLARMSRGGGGGGGQQAPTLYDRMEMGQLDTGYNQPAQQNPWANVTQGVVAGTTQGIMNRINK